VQLPLCWPSGRGLVELGGGDRLSVLLGLGGGDRLAVLLRLGADLAAGRDGPVVLLCAGDQGGGLGGGAGVVAGVDSVAVLLCTVPQVGVLGGLLLCVLVSLGELLLRVLSGLLGHVADGRHVRSLRLAWSLVNVGLGGLDVLHGVLDGVGRCVHGHGHGQQSLVTASSSHAADSRSFDPPLLTLSHPSNMM
jgi:hypothetical protein